MFAVRTRIKFLFDHISWASFPSTLFVAGAMGRRAKNKQGDPLPLHADPDLNGSLKALKLKSKSGVKDKSSVPNLNAKLGKRKAERDDDGDRAAKKPKGVRKPKPHAKAPSAKKPTAKVARKPMRSNGKKVDSEEESIADGGVSVGWEDGDDVDMQVAAR